MRLYRLEYPDCETFLIWSLHAHNETWLSDPCVHDITNSPVSTHCITFAQTPLSFAIPTVAILNYEGKNDTIVSQCGHSTKRCEHWDAVSCIHPFLLLPKHKTQSLWRSMSVLHVIDGWLRRWVISFHCNVFCRHFLWVCIWELLTLALVLLKAENIIQLLHFTVSSDTCDKKAHQNTWAKTPGRVLRSICCVAFSVAPAYCGYFR